MRLFRSPYDYPFDKNLIYEQWTACITYSLRFWGQREVLWTPEKIIILITSPLDYFGHNGRLKILIGCLRGKEGVGGLMPSNGV